MKKLSHSEVFNFWTEKKIKTHNSEYIPDFSVRDIWWTQLGKNIASESLGKGDDFLRPVIILQKFYGSSALVMPLTSQKNKGNYYFSFKDNKGNIQNAILPQIRYIDGKRLKKKLSVIPSKIFKDIQGKLFKLISG